MLITGSQSTFTEETERRVDVSKDSRIIVEPDLVGFERTYPGYPLSKYLPWASNPCPNCLQRTPKVDWLGTAIRVTAADPYQASNSWSKLLFLPEA
jgi:hypothetical protein